MPNALAELFAWCEGCGDIAPGEEMRWTAAGDYRCCDCRGAKRPWRDRGADEVVRG